MVARLASGWSVRAVAAAQRLDPRTVRTWRDRFAVEGVAGLVCRSSRPRRSPRRLDAAAEAEIVGLRRQRPSAPAIARRLGRPVSTVGGVLRRHGLGRLRALEPRPPVIGLAGAGLPLAVVNPAQMRAFARAVGQLAKTDRLPTPANGFAGDPGDAEIIARFADQVRPGPRPVADEDARALAEVVELPARRSVIVVPRTGI